MSKIGWCLKQSCGIKIVDANLNLAQSYFDMANESIETMKRERGKSNIFSVSAGYYSIYYSLYGIMQKIGIKSEIHSCSIEFAKVYLKDFYSVEDLRLLEKAFLIRNNLQYYVDRKVSINEINFVLDGAYSFLTQSRKILYQLTSEKIKSIRESIKNEK
jgi:uncharacterized protein (UPF0332 family)